MRIICSLPIIIVLLTFGKARSQKADGHWYGIGVVQTSKTYQTYLSELILRQKGKAVWGEFHYYFKDSLVKVNINGSYDANTGRLSIKPFAVIYFLSPSARNSIDCKMSGNFLLTVFKTESVLSGALNPDTDHKYTVPPVSLRLVQSNDTLDLVKTEEAESIPQPATVAPIPEPVVVEPSPELQTKEAFSKREKIFTKEIEVTETKLRIEIYDNGQVDYDSVSLFFNNKLILPKTKLSHRAIRLSIDIDPGAEYNELSMFADNLGMIPPNTAALVVYDGKIRYETLLTSDLSKSATIKIKRKLP